MGGLTLDKATIGAILRERIKEKGYSQQDFALEVGISLASLKKYMKGSTAYTYEVMEMLADKLECSYDYLLGLSKSPIKEHHEIAEQTRLSEKAISKIVKYASNYDDNFDAKRYIKCLDMMLCEDGVFSSICDYIISSRYVNDIQNLLVDTAQNAINNSPIVMAMGIEEDKKLSLETQQMIDVICRLKDMKMKMTPEFIAELKELDTDENYNKCAVKVNEFLSKLIVH